MENEITLRQHWYTVPAMGLAERHILDLIAQEEQELSVREQLERHDGVLPVQRYF